jgi:hypothetical protein
VKGCGGMCSIAEHEHTRMVLSSLLYTLVGTKRRQDCGPVLQWGQYAGAVSSSPPQNNTTTQLSHWLGAKRDMKARH